MNDFDKYIRELVQSEPVELPDNVKNKIESALESLPEEEMKVKPLGNYRRLYAIAASVVFIAIVLMPNLSVNYAQAISKIPVIGEFVKVITIRNYWYDDGRHELTVNVPSIEDEDGEAVLYINKDVNEMISGLIKQFYADIKVNGSSGYGSLDVDYEVLTNTEDWFTLKLSVCETAASSNEYHKYYHIDKSSGKIVALKDIFKNDKYKDVIEREIRRQMKSQKAQDDNVEYWDEESDVGESFTVIKDNHGFYWNKAGDLVIVYDKYEVAPGYMGTPEFVIKKNLIEDILK